MIWQRPCLNSQTRERRYGNGQTREPTIIYLGELTDGGRFRQHEVFFRYLVKSFDTLACTHFVQDRGPAVPDPAFGETSPVQTQTTRFRAETWAVRLRLHDLPDFWAAQVLGSNGDPRTLGGRLGYAVSITTRVHAAFLQERNREDAQIMGRLLSGPRLRTRAYEP